MGNKPKLIAKNETLEIDRLGSKGDGITTFKEERAFIDGVLESETVQTDLYRGNDGVLRGKVTKMAQVIKPSPLRQLPQCKHGLICGGCSMQHVADEFYREWKAQQFKDTIERADFDVRRYLPPIYIGERTRRRASFTLLKQNKNLSIGFREKRSHNIININECRIIAEELYELVQNMRPFLMDMLRDSRACSMFVQHTQSGFDVTFTGEIGAKGSPDLQVRMAIADMVRELPITRISWKKRDREDYEILLETNPVYHSFSGLNVALPPACFMQPSKEGEIALVHEITSAIEIFQRSNNAANLEIADLFSGCGTFTGALMAYGRVSAYELDQAATKALSIGLQKTASNQTHKAIKRHLFKEPLSEVELSRFDVIVMDPPRAGAKEQSRMLSELDANKPQLLIYISCNTSSFARDAALITSQDEWSCTSIRMIDQFIWSNHVELCAVFTKN